MFTLYIAACHSNTRGKGWARLGAQAERERFAKLGAERSGRGAETVHRDKASGRRVGADELAAAAEAAQKPKSETPAWGGGIAQARRRCLPWAPLSVLSWPPCPTCTTVRASKQRCGLVLVLGRLVYTLSWQSVLQEPCS